MLYSSYKPGLHLEDLLQIRKGGQPYPKHVLLVISDFCNQNCSFCAYRMPEYNNSQLFAVVNEYGSVERNPRRMIPWEKLREIVDDCAAMGVKAIQLTGGGEPTVHRDFDKLCGYILEKNIHLGIVSNGLLLTPEKAAMAAQGTWLRVSVDAGTAQTYAGIRRVSEQQFWTVEQNIRFLAALPGRRATLGVGFVVTPDNFHELFEACRTFKSWGVDNVRVSTFFQDQGVKVYDEIFTKIQEQLSLLPSLESDGFMIFNNFNQRYSDLAQGAPEYERCGYMNFSTYIGADQNVYTCCINAYNQRGLIGSIRDRRLQELWRQESKQNFFRQFDARGCSLCMFNEKNRIINRLISEPDAHDFFV